MTEKREQTTGSTLLLHLIQSLLRNHQCVHVSILQEGILSSLNVRGHFGNIIVLYNFFNFHILREVEKTKVLY